MRWLKNLAAGCAALGAGAFLGWDRPPAASLSFLSVGQGDCAVLQVDGRTILIDTGPRAQSFDAGERVIIPKLRKMGLSRVDLILLTHPDLDHVGGTASILRAFPGAQVAVPAGFKSDEELREHLEEWGIRESQILWIPRRADLSFGRCEIEMVCPKVLPEAAANDGSLAMRIAIGGASAVLSGDAPTAVEEEIAAEMEWPAQIVKLGHHGSQTSTSLAWMREVQAEWAVVSCGRDNAYGHPHKSVLQTLARFPVRVARTDLEGDITFHLSDGRFRRVRQD